MTLEHDDDDVVSFSFVVVQRVILERGSMLSPTLA